MQSLAAPTRRRLLVVDDDFDLCTSISDLLRSDGYEVVTAADGDAALRHLRQATVPDLIVLDLMMPVKDGWQFRVEQRLDPSLSAIPVLAISADGSPKAASIDADGYLSKPFQYLHLRQEIDRIIESRRLAHLDRMASLGTLAAGIAHEINNPLTYVISNLQLLEEELPASFPSDATPEVEMHRHLEDSSARLRDALEGAERIRNIVLHVKTFSRAGDEHRALVDVRSVLDSSIKIVASEVRQKACLVKDYQHTPLVLAGPGQLGQVFLNMLLNAAQATEGNADDNEIRVATRTRPDGRVVVEFRDTGIGIPPEVRHRIFDPFFTTKPMAAGTGLGLSVCHGIIQSLGGSIEVDSDVGKGTTFRIVLSPAGAPRETATRPDAIFTRGRRGHILVVDDEPRLAEAIRRMLAKEHDVTIALDGKGALELVAKQSAERPFDVILCDLYLPGLTGMDVYEHLERTNPDVARRMVFMTGGVSDARAHDFAARVKNPLIEKPIDIKAFRSLLWSMLEKSGG
jgi:signal transduction histidine kinase